MTNEELILKKLDHLEAQIEPIINFSKSATELRDDLVPLGNQATAILINELQEVEAGFQLEDLLRLVKQAMRSTNNLVFMMRQMNSIIEFVKDLEPLLKSTVPLVIDSLDKLEQQGVFRIVKATLDIRAKIASAYTPEDIEKIGDGLVVALGLAKKLSEPVMIAFLEKVTDLPAALNLADAKKTGPFGLLSAGFDPEIKEGIGVVLELTKALSGLKETTEKNEDGNVNAM